MATNYLPSWKSRAVKVAFAVAFILFYGVSPVAAQTNGTDGSGSNVTCGGNVPAQFQEITTLLTRVQQIGIAFALSIASVMLIYGGILWMRGNPESQQKARTIIFNTFVGLLIVLMAGGLVEFMKSVLCGGGG